MTTQTSPVVRLVSSNSETLISACKDIATDQLPHSLKMVLDEVDDALFELANKTDSSLRQTAYFDAMRELRLKRDTFASEFMALFESEFDSALDLEKRRKAERAFAETVELSMVDSDEVEEELAAANFVDSLKTSCREELFALDQRIGTLLNDPALENIANPLGPATIATAFRGACKDLSAGVEIKITLFKLLDKLAQPSIHTLYHDVNEFLIGKDVLPTLSSRVRRNPAGKGKTRIIIESDNESTEAIGEDVFSTLQQLLQPNIVQNYAGGTASAVATTSPLAQFLTAPAATAQLLSHGLTGANALPTSSVFFSPGGSVADALTLMQRGDLSADIERQLASGDNSALATPFNVLHLLRETGALGELNQSDATTLDIVTVLFDYILDDPSIPDAIKVLVGRLQIPVLKVALTDKAVFSKKTHPARRLIDSIVHASFGWNEGLEHKNALYQMIEYVVHRICEEFNDDVALFGEVLVEFEAFLENESQQIERRAKEAAKSLSSKEQIVAAKMVVDEKLNELLEVGETKVFIRQFILDYWRQFLMITYVEEGLDSQAWSHQLETVQTLLWSVEPKATRVDRRKLTSLLPNLVRDLRYGMSVLEMDTAVCSKFLSMLASVHVVSVKNSQEAEATKQVVISKVANGPDVVEEVSFFEDNNEDFMRQGLARMFESQGVQEEEMDLEIDFDAFEARVCAQRDGESLGSQIPQNYIDQVMALDLGDWVEFKQEDGTSVQARFSWISETSGWYLFSDRDGEKVLESDFETLATRFMNETACAIESQPDPIFDRAIADLMAKLEAEPPNEGVLEFPE